MPFILVVVFIDVLGIGIALPVLPMLVGPDDLGVANARSLTGVIVWNQLAGPPVGAALFAAGMALPVFRAYREGGVEAAGAYVDRLVAGLKLAMVLTGSRDLETLGHAPVVLGGRLRDWLVAEGGA